MNVADLRHQLRDTGQLTLAVKVIPKASRTEWADPLTDGSYKIKLAAAPEKGRANEELRRFLAAEFGLSLYQVELVSGATSARKRVRLHQ